MAEAKVAEEKKGDWVFGEIYGKAYRIATKNPTLWWFALALGAGSFFNGGGSGGHSSSSSSSNSDVFKNLLQQGAEKQSGLPLARVLGDSTSPLLDIWNQTIHIIPWYFYAILISEIILCIIGAIIVGLIYKAWAQASLLSGVEDAIAEKKVDMSVSSEKAFPLIKSFIWLNTIPMIVILIPAIIAGIFAFNSISHEIAMIPPPKTADFAVHLMTYIIDIGSYIALAGGILSLGMIWAQRLVVVQKFPAKKALFTGFRIAKKKFWKTLLYGWLNGLSTGIVMAMTIIIPLIILGIVGSIGFLSLKGIPAIGITLLGIDVILFVVWIGALMILTGVIETFKTAVWSIAYNKIKGKYED